MAVSSLYTIANVYFDVASDWYLNQITDWSFDPAISQILQAADGHVDPTFAACGTSAPRISVTNTAIARTLDVLGITGQYFSGTTGVYAYLKALDEGGTRKGASNHYKLSCTEKALTLPRSLSAPHEGGVATLTTDILFYSSDGSTAPITISSASNQSIDDLAASPKQYYVAGGASINGNAINGVTNITVDFGISELVSGGDGQVFPTFIAIQTRRPSITIDTVDATSLYALGASGDMTGVAQGATDSVVYFKAIAEGGKRVGGGSDISFSVNQGRIQTGAITGSTNGIATHPITITPTWDESTATAIMVYASNATAP